MAKRCPKCDATPETASTDCREPMSENCPGALMWRNAEPSDIVERLRDHANEIVATLGQATGGPLMTKCDAVRYVETYLRETYVAEITRLRAALDEAFIQGLENAADIAKGERIEATLRSKVEHLRGRTIAK